MVIATRIRMPTVMGMPMTMCTGSYTIGKHAAGSRVPHLGIVLLLAGWDVDF